MPFITLNPAAAENGLRAWDLDLDVGLYQVSVIADMAEFPLESLYYEMQEFGNAGARTGPWDFKPMVGSPLVPAWWVYLDEEKLGLWCFQRISIEDLEARIFRGNFAFRIRTDGRYHLRLEPYLETANAARWLDCVLQSDPVDSLAPFDVDLEARVKNLSVRQWEWDAFWMSMRERAAHDSLYGPVLKPALGWVLDPNRQGQKDATGRWRNADNAGPMDMTTCVAGWRLFGDITARDQGIQLLEELLALPGWGRPQEDIYGWDGDLVAIDPMRACIQGYFGLADAITPEFREKIRKKLRYQGDRFVTMALLTRDYWGGSVLQDHGWRAILGFAECAINLLGEIEEAEEWLEWAIPRFRRALAAMPPDGHLPASSYETPGLYILPLARLRKVWQEVTGEDIYLSAPVRMIVDRLGAYVNRPEREPLLIASNLFLQQMALLHPDSAAGFWLEKCVRLSEEKIRSGYFSFHWHAQGIFEGFLSLPKELPKAKHEVTVRSFTHFEDAGRVTLRDSSGLDLTFQCGPWLGHHAYVQSDNPCDRMCMEPGPGHFKISVDGKPVIVRPDSNYALRSGAHNCLLIDGRGQIGDIDYPMSLPSWQWKGERITSLLHDPVAETLFARLDLAPLYPASTGVLRYARDFLVTRPGELICRDHLVLKRPLPLEWRFHTTEGCGILPCEDPLQYRFGETLTLEARTNETPLESAIRPTSVIFSYTGSGKKFLHTAFRTLAPVAAARVEYVFRIIQTAES